MVNPYTKSLLDELGDNSVRAWILAWDAFESLVIEIFRAGKVGPEQRQGFIELTRWLQTHYPRWQDELESRWRGLSAGGKKIEADPFSTLLAAPNAASFIDDWEAMQLLPAAREAINLYLMEQLQARDQQARE